MNKYEIDGTLSAPVDRVAKIAADKNYSLFAEIVLNTKDYALGKARKLLENLSFTEIKNIFERFNREEGALPDKLALEYIKLIYSPENILEKMKGERNFYEVLAEIGREIKEAGVELDQELVREQVKKISRELLKEPEGDVDNLDED